MIVKIEAQIFGSFSIEKEMNVKNYPFDINIRFDTNLKGYFISISGPVINYFSHLPKLEIDELRRSEIRFPEQSFLDEQIKILQHIESFGAIDQGIEKINWQSCSIEWIPETHEEGAELSIRKYNRTLSYGLNPKVLSRDWLNGTIIHRKQLEHLALPFAFFREGANHYHSFQYQNASINFYLMLEGFFGNGKHTNESMKHEFAKSDILTHAIREAIIYFERINGKHYLWLQEICKIYNKQVDKEGVIHVLVEQRGKLSHFSQASSSKQKNPFKDRDYDDLAFLAMTICVYCSIKLRIEPFVNKRQKHDT